jgi:hypothetical protein
MSSSIDAFLRVTPYYDTRPDKLRDSTKAIENCFGRWIRFREPPFSILDWRESEMIALRILRSEQRALWGVMRRFKEQELNMTLVSTADAPYAIVASAKECWRVVPVVKSENT